MRRLATTNRLNVSIPIIKIVDPEPGVGGPCINFHLV